MKRKKEISDKSYFYVVIIIIFCFLDVSVGNIYGTEQQAENQEDPCKVGQWSSWGEMDCATQSKSRTRELIDGDFRKCLSKLHEMIYAKIPTPVVSEWSEWGTANDKGIRKRLRTVKGQCAQKVLGPDFQTEETKYDLWYEKPKTSQEKNRIANSQVVSKPERELKIEPFVPVKINLFGNKSKESATEQSRNSKSKVSVERPVQKPNLMSKKEQIVKVNESDHTPQTNYTKHDHFRKIISKIAQVYFKEKNENDSKNKSHGNISFERHGNGTIKIVHSVNEDGKSVYKKYFVLQAKPLDYYYKIPSYRIYTKPLKHILKGEYHKSPVMNEKDEIISTTPKSTTASSFWEQGGFLDFHNEHNRWLSNHVDELTPLSIPDNFDASGFYGSNPTFSEGTHDSQQSFGALTPGGFGSSQSSQTAGGYGSPQTMSNLDTLNQQHATHLGGGYGAPQSTSHSGVFNHQQVALQPGGGGYGAPPLTSHSGVFNHQQQVALQPGGGGGGYGAPQSTSHLGTFNQHHIALQQEGGGYGAPPLATHSGVFSQHQVVQHSEGGGYGTPQSASNNEAYQGHQPNPGSYDGQQYGGHQPPPGAFNSQQPHTEPYNGQQQVSHSGGYGSPQSISGTAGFGGQQPASGGNTYGSTQQNQGESFVGENIYLSPPKSSDEEVKTKVDTQYKNDRQSRKDYLKKHRDFSDIFSILSNNEKFSGPEHNDDTGNNEPYHEYSNNNNNGEMQHPTNDDNSNTSYF